MSTNVKPTKQGIKHGGSDVHLTPLPIVDCLPEALGSTYLDPCACIDKPSWTKCSAYYAWPEQDGLKEVWHLPAYVNPPFSKIKLWITKSMQSKYPVLMLAKFDCRTNWCNELVAQADSAMVLKGYWSFDAVSSKQNNAMFMIGLYAMHGASLEPFKGLGYNLK